MTTVDEATAAVVRRFLTEWADATPVYLDNEQEAPPAGQSWARLTVRHRDGGPSTMGSPGNRRFRRSAAAYVQVFVPAAEGGRKTADQLAQSAMDIFEGVSLAGTSVSFGAVRMREDGPDGPWFAVTVEASFTYEEIK